jgi:membrane protease YdiL (CAAX protease family)
MGLADAGRPVAPKSRAKESRSTVHDAKRTGSPYKKNLRWIYAAIIAYLSYLTVAEYTTTYVDRQTGILLHAFLLLVLLFVSSLLYNDKLLSCFVMSLIVTPLIRIMASSMPVNLLNHQLLWFSLINFPLLVMVFLLAGYQGLTRQDIGLVYISPDSADRRKAYLMQFAIMFTGPVFGVMEYYILKPAPIIDSLTYGNLLSSFLTFTIFTGLIEEVVFRGIIQRNAEKVIGVFNALFFTAFLFGVMHIGWQSYWDLLFVFSVGFFYGVVFYKTRSLFGITISHGLTNTVLFAVAPFFLK